MRKFVLVVLVFALTAAGYTLYWYKKAGDFKQVIELSIAHINDNAKVLDPKLTLVHYDAITLTGFPFSARVDLVKPVIDLPVSLFIKNVSATLNPGQPPSMPAFNWVEELSYPGNISLTGNLLGNDFTFTSTGEHTLKSLVDGKTRHILQSTASPFSCHLNVQFTGGSSWTMRPAVYDPNRLLIALRTLNCSSDNMTLKDGISGAPLFTSGKIAIEVNSDPQDATQRKFSFLVNDEHSKATPAADALIADYMHMIYTLTGTPESQQTAPTPLSAYGDQNIGVNISYAGPTDMEQFSSPALHFTLDIKKLEMKNALYNASYSGRVNSEPQEGSGSSRNTAVALHGTSEVTEQYDTLLLQEFTGIIKSILQSPMPPDADASISQTLAKLGAPAEIAAAALPKFHTFGKTTVDIDASLTGSNDPKAIFKQGALTLGTLDWVTTPYGIKIKGNSTYVQEKPPTADFTTTCLSCDTLLTDMGDYAMRIEGLVIRVSPHTPYVTKDFIEGVRQFVHGIAENASAKDLVTHFVMKNGQFVISDRQLPQVLTLFATTIAPHLQPQQPASAPAPAEAPPESPAR